MFCNLVDTFRHALIAYDHDLKTGVISNQRKYIKFEKDEFPDGMAMDAEGGFWIAIRGGNKIIHFDADGEKIAVLIFHPTFVALEGRI